MNAFDFLVQSASFGFALCLVVSLIGYGVSRIWSLLHTALHK